MINMKFKKLKNHLFALAILGIFMTSSQASAAAGNFTAGLSLISYPADAQGPIGSNYHMVWTLQNNYGVISLTVTYQVQKYVHNHWQIKESGTWGSGSPYYSGYTASIDYDQQFSYNDIYYRLVVTWHTSQYDPSLMTYVWNTHTEVSPITTVLAGGGSCGGCGDA